MLKPEDAARITAAIKDAEARTSSEIVVCIRGSSGEDRGLAALLGLMALGVAAILASIFFPNLHVYVLFAVSLAIGICTFLAVDWLDLGLRFLPEPLVREPARQAARAHFIDHGLDATAERNAVLLFVSRAERYVEVLPDRALVAAVQAQRWTNVIDGFRRRAARDGVVEAVVEAVGAIGAICAGPFPAATPNPNVIADTPHA